jgi:DNA-binding CsgD family transcriptional regulator
MLTERVRAQVEGLAMSGLDVPAFAESALAAVKRAVPFAACFATSDPATGLVTGTVKEAIDDHHDEEWAHFEYVVPDSSAFLEISRRPGRVVGLQSETGGRPERSPRFSDFIRRYWDFGDEMRAVLTVDGMTWGFMALFREGPGAAFTPLEQEFLSSVGASLAVGLRSGLLAAAAAPAGPHVDGPAVLIVDPRGEIASASVGAAAQVADLGGGPLGEAQLPLALLGLVGAARRYAAEGRAVVPRVRLRTRSGHWVVAHASPLMSRDGTSSDVVLTIEEARPPEIVPIVVAAFGLTPRERDVVQLVLQGVDTSGIARTLHLSAYTVQDHLKAVFAKVGVRSRRELTAKVYFDQYAPRLAAGAEVGPSGWFRA